jgi:hypothetical protein
MIKKYNLEDAVKEGLVSIENVSVSTNTATMNMGILSSLMYPLDLEPHRTMTIKAYNTTDADITAYSLYDTTKSSVSWVASQIGDKISAAVDSVTSKSESKPTKGIKTTGNSIMNVQLPDLPPLDGGNARLKKHFKGSIYLPLPNSLSEALSNNYSEQQGWINDAAEFGSKFLPDSVEKAVGGIQKVSAGYAKATGSREIKFYENKIQMFNGSNFRTISLTWRLVPNNRTESKIIHDIVKQIKTWGTPESVAGKILIKEPHFFELEFVSKDHVLNKALNFCEVVLTDISVDYVSGGKMEMYEDSLPKYIDVSMTFRDRMPKLANEWEASCTSDGVEGDTTC